jgi:hypothetical protein
MLGPMSVTCDRTTNRRTDMLRHVAGIELPAAGVWHVPAHHATISLLVPRRVRRAGRVVGRATHAALAFSDDPDDVTVEIAFEATGLAGDRDTGLAGDRDVHLVARSTGGAGRWSLDGTAVASGSVRRVRAHLAYHGVWRRGDRPYGWFVLAGTIAPAAGSLGRRVGFSFELLAGAPERASA